MSILQKLHGRRLAQVLGGFWLPSFKREEGQTLAEYAMILALIAIVVVVAVTFLRRATNRLQHLLEQLHGHLTTPAVSGTPFQSAQFETKYSGHNPRGTTQRSIPSGTKSKIGLWLVVAAQGLSLQSLEREEGQTLAEYAMILALIAIVVVGAVVLLGSKISTLFSNIGSDI